MQLLLKTPASGLDLPYAAPTATHGDGGLSALGCLLALGQCGRPGRAGPGRGTVRIGRF